MLVKWREVRLFHKRKNIEGKGEIVRNEQFLLFRQCLFKPHTISIKKSKAPVLRINEISLYFSMSSLYYQSLKTASSLVTMNVLSLV